MKQSSLHKKLYIICGLCLSFFMSNAQTPADWVNPFIGTTNYGVITSYSIHYTKLYEERDMMTWLISLCVLPDHSGTENG